MLCSSYAPFLRSKYLDEKLSANQISKIFECSRSAVVSNLKRYGIKLRSQEESRKLRKGAMGYGEKIETGKIQAHLRELEVISKIKNLRTQGLSYWKIAGILNTMEIPTKKKRARWHATTVMNILKKEE